MLLNGSQVNVNKKSEVNMKETGKKKLTLKKITIRDYGFVLDRAEQKTARGGSGNEQPGKTEIIIFC
jgi:hypothetical protein